MESLSGNHDFSASAYDINETCFEKGDFLEREYSQLSQGSHGVRGRLKRQVFAWEEIEAPNAVLSVIKEGYKLPLLPIPASCILPNNKSALDKTTFVAEAIEDLLAAQCISVVSGRPCMGSEPSDRVNPGRGEKAAGA